MSHLGCKTHLAKHSCFKLVSGIRVKMWRSLEVEVRGRNFHGTFAIRIIIRASQCHNY